MIQTLRLLFLCIAVVSLIAPGCSSKTSTDSKTDPDKSVESGEKHAETYAEAVAELDGLATSIKDAFTANDEDKAHGPLHDVGHILGEIPALADKESISDEDKTAIKSAVEDLFESFGKLDDKMHGGEGATYEEVAGKIDQAMATLKKYAGPQETE
jgi:hypothetical protein